MNRGNTALWNLLGIGWYFAIAVVLGTVLGVWLDGVTNRSPLFTLLGLGLGLMVAFVGSYQMIRKALYPKDPGGS